MSRLGDNLSRTALQIQGDPVSLAYRREGRSARLIGSLSDDARRTDYGTQAPKVPSRGRPVSSRVGDDRTRKEAAAEFPDAVTLRLRDSLRLCKNTLRELFFTQR